MSDELRRYLRERRQAAGLTQRQLGDLLGWDQTTISDIETGSRRITVTELVDMAAVLRFDAGTALRRITKGRDA